MYCILVPLLETCTRAHRNHWNATLLSQDLQLHHSTALLQGTRIRDFMTAIPCDRTPPPIMCAYVDLNLKILTGTGIISASGTNLFDRRDASDASPSQARGFASP